FLIIAFSIFIALRFYNKLRDKDEAEKAPPPGPTTTEKLLMEIRDELKK
ncbi:MAG: MscL family protein, partial [Taibaiella sp.]|nr:MscL family protein [Taibaiella sp.]